MVPTECISEIDEVFGFLFRDKFFKIGRILSFWIFPLLPGCCLGGVLLFVHFGWVLWSG